MSSVRDGGDDRLGPFLREIRRSYPFCPFGDSRVQDEFDRRVRRSAEGTWVLLDLYGAYHGPRMREES